MILITIQLVRFLQNKLENAIAFAFAILNILSVNNAVVEHSGNRNPMDCSLIDAVIVIGFLQVNPNPNR